MKARTKPILRLPLLPPYQWKQCPMKWFSVGISFKLKKRPQFFVKIRYRHLPASSSGPFLTLPLQPIIEFIYYHLYWINQWEFLYFIVWLVSLSATSNRSSAWIQRNLWIWFWEQKTSFTKTLFLTFEWKRAREKKQSFPVYMSKGIHLLHSHSSNWQFISQGPKSV